MSLDFNKASEGTTLNFSKDLGLDFSKSANIMVNLNWGKLNGRSVDLDSTLALVSGKPAEKQGLLSRMFSKALGSKTLKSFTYCFGLTAGRRDGIKHYGDDLTGACAEGEFIEIDGTKVGDDVIEIVPGILSFSGHDLSTLPFAHMRVYLGTPDRIDTPLFEVDLTNMKRGTMGAVFGKIVRDDSGEWTWVSKQAISKQRGFDSLKELSLTL